MFEFGDNIVCLCFFVSILVLGRRGIFLIYFNIYVSRGEVIKRGFGGVLRIFGVEGLGVMC